MRWPWIALMWLPIATAAQASCPKAGAYSAERRGTAVLIIRDGRAVCATPVDAAPGQELWSGTKSVVGLAAAAAVQDGLLRLDEIASDTLVEWRADPLKRGATIRQLLSMTAGLPSQIGKPPGYRESLALAFNASPGERFQYGPAPIQAFGELLTRKLRASGSSETVEAYIRRRLFAPIGLNVAQWRRGSDGNALLPQGLVLTAVEWAKLGRFVLDRGRVGGRAILDPATFSALFTGSAANPGYGLTWWIAKGPPSHDPVSATIDIGISASGMPADLVVAAGAGNQRLYVVPSLKLIIVRQAVIDPMALARLSPLARSAAERWSDTAFLNLVFADLGIGRGKREARSPSRSRRVGQPDRMLSGG